MLENEHMAPSLSGWRCESRVTLVSQIQITGRLPDWVVGNWWEMQSSRFLKPILPPLSRVCSLRFSYLTTKVAQSHVEAVHRPMLMNE